MRQAVVRVVATVLVLWVVCGVAAPASATPVPLAPDASSTTPTPPPGIPDDGSTYEVPPESTTTSDVLVIIGFSVIAMAGLVFFIRAGMKAASSEDD